MSIEHGAQRRARKRKPDETNRAWLSRLGGGLPAGTKLKRYALCAMRIERIKLC